VREPVKKRGNRETLSMIMLDYDYDAETDVFRFADVFYADAIEAAGWKVCFPAERLARAPCVMCGRPLGCKRGNE
jgi:hypothetical protein